MDVSLPENILGTSGRAADVAQVCLDVGPSSVEDAHTRR